MAAVKVVGATPAAAKATLAVSRPSGGRVAMSKTRVEVDLGRSRKSRSSGLSGWI
jgi:hypothetical protein